MNDTRAVILFDGVCNLCNGFVQFVIERDSKNHFQFGSLQSDAAKHLLSGFPEANVHSLNTVVLIDNGKLYAKSDAALRVLSRLKAPWNLLRVGFVFPLFIRNAVYDFIAKNRYAWFGQRDVCMIPTRENKRRFID